MLFLFEAHSLCLIGVQAQTQSSANTTERTVNEQWATQHTVSRYTEVHRSWPTNVHQPSTQSRSYASHFADNTQSMTPIDCWAAESSQQAFWNPIDSFGTSSNSASPGGANSWADYPQQTGGNWSTCGNQSTK